MGRSWARLGGENSLSKGFWGRRQAKGCFRRCRGEGFCAGGMVARQTAPGCTLCVWTEKSSARTKRARPEAPRTGVYVISAWNVRRTGRTGCNRGQVSFFADVSFFSTVETGSFCLMSIHFSLTRLLVLLAGFSLGWCFALSFSFCWRPIHQEKVFT